MSPKSRGDINGEHDMAETRRRCQRINHYLDLIPARFYLSQEVVSATIKASGKWGHLDPSIVKSTTEILRLSQEPKDENQKQKKNKKKNKQRAPPERAGEGRAALVAKLHQKIDDMKEERRSRQSSEDKAKAAEIRANREKEPKDQSRKAAKLEGKRRKLEQEEEPEAGRLNFEAGTELLPFDAAVGHHGQKARKLQKDLRKREVEALKLKEAQSKGQGEDLRKELAYEKALRRARGDKVHDDVSKLRKVQKTMEMKKKKGQERWKAKIENDKQKVDEQQAQRRENLKNRGTKKKSKMKRIGSEEKN